jgi:uncharacterized membrane-anchored protein
MSDGWLALLWALWMVYVIVVAILAPHSDDDERAGASGGR